VSLVVRKEDAAAAAASTPRLPTLEELKSPKVTGKERTKSDFTGPTESDRKLEEKVNSSV
jgi:hypothetical protein